MVLAEIRYGWSPESSDDGGNSVAVSHYEDHIARGPTANGRGNRVRVCLDWAAGAYNDVWLTNRFHHRARSELCALEMRRDDGSDTRPCERGGKIGRSLHPRVSENWIFRRCCPPLGVSHEDYY